MYPTWPAVWSVTWYKPAFSCVMYSNMACSHAMQPFMPVICSAIYTSWPAVLTSDLQYACSMLHHVPPIACSHDMRPDTYLQSATSYIPRSLQSWYSTWYMPAVNTVIYFPCPAVMICDLIYACSPQLHIFPITFSHDMQPDICLESTLSYILPMAGP
jgi:hypothetical protein